MWYVLNVCTVTASHYAVSDPERAKRFGRTSIGMSVAGIVFTVVALIIIFTVVVHKSCKGWKRDGVCYNYRFANENGYLYCSGVKSGNYCYYN